ncbi:calcitonin gene-related peptide type 1 receptor-like isoform X2 [Protopterus annectens]|uniref:calcitonin gene-related peptide type 1 receptor-like isoform X2 n=1 Tax=Protopterus annectens TaxID=7888 RepID=UPI001CFC1448|nr:calcitonin gene-related peptide type 1 receptor-like isoform X2 [Protopterus annectens]
MNIQKLILYLLLHFFIMVYGSPSSEPFLTQPTMLPDNDSIDTFLNVNFETMGTSQKQILTAQFECYMKIIRDPPYSKPDTVCNRTWDGWLCWDDFPAGDTAHQSCPEYFHDFDPVEKVTKICEKDGQWFRHPESKRTWSNYTLCSLYTKENLKTAVITYYLEVTGNCISIVSLTISLFIFYYFKSLSCQRISLHKNLFLSFLLHSVVTVTWLKVITSDRPKTDVAAGCKVLFFLQVYLMGCNCFWMLCEGIYLHTLIIVAVFIEKQQLRWYYLLGWLFPLAPAIILALARTLYYNDNCWISVHTHLNYIIHGPIYVALVVNLFFLLNIMRVLIIKLKVTHQAETSTYAKAARATLILVPLLGIHYVIMPWIPNDHTARTVYDYVSHITSSYQGLLVSTIFCFFNGEVQAAVKRQWHQCRAQFGHSMTSNEGSQSNCQNGTQSYYLITSSENEMLSYHLDHSSSNGKSNGHSSSSGKFIPQKATGKDHQ